jgi:nucleoside-diphosphate-sugar epimerase
MVFGPRDRQHRLYPYLKRMDDGRTAILLEEGQARWRTTRGFAEDMAGAVVLAVTDERAAGRVYNVGESEALSESAWVERIGRAVGWSGRIVTLPAARLPKHLDEEIDAAQDLVCDTARIRAELGYRERVAPEDAMRRTVAWEREHPPEKIDPASFDYAAEDAAIGSA